MKILQVCPRFHHYVASGSTKVAYDISKELVRRGHSVTVYTSDMRDKYNRIGSGFEKKEGILVYRFQSIGTVVTREMKIFITPKIIPKLKSEIHSFDVIHLHEYQSFQNMIVHYYAKKYRVPYVLHAHGSIPRIGKRFRKWLYDVVFGYRLLRDASKVIALSEPEAKEYEQAGVPREKITIIPNGIDLSEYADLPPKRPFKKKFGLDENEKIVLYLGRIHKIKGIDILVRAFAYIAEKLDDVKLVIVGPDDGYLRELEALIRALKLEDKVLVSGPLYGRGKLEAYVDADVYVLPSRYETFPIGLLEAYACGKPVIASDVGGLRELVINGVTGLLVKPEVVEDLTYCVFSILNNANVAKKMGLEGIRLVKECFSIEKVTDQLEQIYNSILESPLV